MAEEPTPTAWRFPPANTADERGLVAVGGDYEPGTLLAAYRQALFPMPVSPGGPLGWWSPDPRGIVPLDGLRVTRSLRRSCRRYDVRVDTAFEDVLDACADQPRPHGWITPAIRAGYTELHQLGWVHSVEAWNPDTEILAGGLYGVAIGGLFAGESMFHRETDASKVALVGLVERLQDDGHDGAGRLLDIQWLTPHLEALGAVEVPIDRYLELLETALTLPPPPAFSRPAE